MDSCSVQDVNTGEAAERQHLACTAMCCAVLCTAAGSYAHCQLAEFQNLRDRLPVDNPVHTQ